MQYNNTKDTKKLLEIFCSDEYGSSNEEYRKNLIRIVEYYKENGRHQYHIISRFVNEKMMESDDRISYILNNIDEMLRFLAYESEECEKIISDTSTTLNREGIILKLEKLYDHIALEEERLKNNASNMQRSNEQIRIDVVNNFNSITYDFQRKVDEVSGSLNANIITVVGLFSAIIFVFFGGITGMAGVVKGICELKDKEDITIPLLCLTMIGFIMFNIIFFLLYTISKLVDKNIGMTVNSASCNKYSVEDIGNGCYGIWCNGAATSKCYKDYQKALKKVGRKNWIAKKWYVVKNWGVRSVFRFPYVLIINIILIVSTIYLYKQL